MITNEVAFRERHDEEKIEICRTWLRGSSGLSHLQILGSYVEGKRKMGGPRRTWMKDIME